MAKLDVSIPDLELPDGNKIPYVSRMDTIGAEQ